MKRINKKITVISLAVLIIILSALPVFAETIYYYNGYQYTYINNEKVSLYGWTGEETDITIPDVINGRKVVEIRNYAFMNNTELTSVDFSTDANLERIGSFSFSGAVNLGPDIIIPESVINIGKGAFQGCDLIESAVINANTSEVPNQCFYQCDILSSVTLNENTTSIGSYAFADCPALTYIEIPSTVTSIDATSFENDDITLGVYTKSYAHQYAIDNEIPYVLLDYNERYFLHGDVDGDGDIGISDVTLLQRIIAHMVEPDTKMAQRDDVNLDGDYNIMDATVLQRHIAHMETGLGIGVDYLEYN